MNESARITHVHGWSTRDPWMMRKRKKKPIEKWELVELVHGPGREVSKLTEGDYCWVYTYMEKK